MTSGKVQSGILTALVSTTLDPPHDRRPVWVEFKEFYDKAFTEKEVDNILTDNKGKAKAAI